MLEKDCKARPFLHTNRILVSTSQTWLTKLVKPKAYIGSIIFRDCGLLWTHIKSVFVGSSLKWRAVWIHSERWMITEGGGWGWLCGSCQNPQAVMIICQDLLCNKKAYLHRFSLGLYLCLCLSTYRFCLLCLICPHCNHSFFKKENLCSVSCCIGLIIPKLAKLDLLKGIQTDLNPGSFDLFTLQLTTVGNKNRVLWCLRWLLNTLSNVYVLYMDTLYSMCCPPCSRLIAHSLITYYWQAVLQTLCVIQGTLAVSIPLLMLRMINGMLMCSRVKALWLWGDVIDCNVPIKWNSTADY